MSYLDLLILAYKYIAVVGLLMVGAFALLMLLQLISYRLLGFNLYKSIKYQLFDKQL